MAEGQPDTRLAEAVHLREQGNLEQARDSLLRLLDQFPDDAEIAYQTGWAHDALGLEAEAVPFYERALASAGLTAEDRRGAFLGLGSTLRTLGRYHDAVATLRRGLKEFPADNALRTFLSMALYNTGNGKEAVETLLKLLAETSKDEQVQRYHRAIELYADDLDATW